MGHTGRRPGTPETREATLEPARQGFRARGYEATSFRNIAEEAGVGPALLVHYFGNKEGLFVAAHQLPIRPSETFAGLEGANTTEASQLIVRAYLHTMSGPLRGCAAGATAGARPDATPVEQRRARSAISRGFHG
ncbi:MAG: helix-turn-helix transcriptional regulator [Actinobacteria bacterium]|nr:MAG: helix-turn-helix transcriptional regulator [Actinomycetota bacterium]